MDDFNEKLDRLLSDPAAVAKVQAMFSSMTGGDTSSAPPPASSPASPPEKLPSPPAGNPDDAALLKALRPYVHGEREKKLDEAIKLVELSRLLPLLRS